MPDTAATPQQEDHFDGKDGVRIFFRTWQPATQPAAVIAICHGFNSHSGQYLWAGEHFAGAGYATFALDLRGRGRSEGERFFVETIDDYVDDLGRLIDLARSRHPDLPVFLLGHSAGGVTSAVYALGNQDKLAGFICESFAYQVPAPDIALAVIKGLSHLAPHLHVLKLKIDDFSRDPEMMAVLKADPFIADEVQPTQTVAAMVRGDERLKREFPTITLPLLILHGAADKVTRPGGSQEFFDAAGSADKTLKLYDGHYHDLLADTGREGVMADILGWIAARA